MSVRYYSKDQKENHKYVLSYIIKFENLKNSQYVVNSKVVFKFKRLKNLLPV